jgi:hypothetical protein
MLLKKYVRSTYSLKNDNAIYTLISLHSISHIYVKIRVTYSFVPCGLTTLFFAPCILFCITASTPIMDKYENDKHVAIYQIKN